MARDRGPPVLRSSAALPGAPPAQPGGLGAAGLWPALLVGLLAALLAWLWYGRGDGEPAGAGAQSVERALPKDEAAARSSPGKAAEELAAGPGRELNHVRSDGVAGEPLEMERLLPTPAVGASEEHPAAARRGSQAGEARAQAGQASDGRCAGSAAGAAACSDKAEEHPPRAAESGDVDHEEWEVLSEHLAWGEAGKNGSVEDSDGKEWEQGDCPDGDPKAKRVAAVPPMFQNIHVTFRVHYLTHCDAQGIGVTGDHDCLGQWHSYIPLKYDKDGFWSESVALPVDTKVEWKFILVENGKVTRWEECGNRTLVTEHEDQIVHRWWGYH
ncbi:starch-binding domain-containing protein 1 isoform X2 [Cuculus canorus]|uniref:starch-binding domain-containing protein 1 isoform X2 n=1 Tax=Cuculus canorus TaxID=55661 RepID=UPI0023AADD82|nr:starch-binding domain-containing protein 1 isoform X2 [Cuculus canorus]